MDAVPYRWEDLDADSPIPLLSRRRVEGEQALVARVVLTQGCEVPRHHHASEQFSILISGRVRWFYGGTGAEDATVYEMTPGGVMHLPSDVPHGLIALEDSEVIDVLSPPAAMGIDQTAKA